MTATRHKPLRKLLVNLGSLLVLGLVMYVLAWGPLLVMAERGYLPNEGVVVDCLRFIYRPVQWAYDNCEPVRFVMNSYIQILTGDRPLG